MSFIITSIVIPSIILIGMVYVVGHQYGEQQSRWLAKQARRNGTV